MEEVEEEVGGGVEAVAGAFGEGGHCRALKGWGLGCEGGGDRMGVVGVGGWGEFMGDKINGVDVGR